MQKTKETPHAKWIEILYQRGYKAPKDRDAHRQHTLTKEQERFIANSTKPIRHLSKQFGVCENTIQNIRKKNKLVR